MTQAGLSLTDKLKNMKNGRVGPPVGIGRKLDPETAVERQGSRQVLDQQDDHREARRGHDGLLRHRSVGASRRGCPRPAGRANS